MKLNLGEYCKRKDEDFLPHLMEAMLIVDDLMLWMLAGKKNLFLAGKLQSASQILDSVYGARFNEKGK